MKKLKLAFTALLGLVVAAPALAANTDQIIVYSAPNTQKVLEKLPGDASLIPIYRQKQWVKVGDPRNGRVGWVNKKQVRKAREAFFRPDIQTIYIHTDRAKSGKPQLNIVAYKNGKKLSPEQAQRLYQRMRKNQLREMRRMRHMTRWMDQQFFETAPMFQPMIVLPAPPPKAAQPLKAQPSHTLES